MTIGRIDREGEAYKATYFDDRVSDEENTAVFPTRMKAASFIVEMFELDHE